MEWHLTRWSIIDGTRAGSREALAELCRMYRPAVLALAHIHQVEDAEDATHDFFAHLLEHEVIGDATRERGRFRAFLRATFRDFISKRRRHAAAAKRVGDLNTESLDDHIDSPELIDQTSDPDDAFNLTWARSLVAHATEALAGEYDRRGLADRFAVMRAFLFREPRAGEYDKLAPRVGLTPNALSSAVGRMRDRHRMLVMGFVADTTAASEEEVVAEFEELVGALGRLVRWG